MTNIISKTVEYYHGKERLIAYLAYPEGAQNCPGILIVHDWAGLNDLYKNRAIELAQQGYVAFAVDMYGEGRTGKTNEQKQALMSPLMKHRELLRERVRLAWEQLKKMPALDVNRTGAMGFCFGGLCVLDLARMGAPLQTVVSFHGLLKDAPECPMHPIQAKILVLHGYDDTMVSPQDILEFCQEMKSKNAYFQVNMYAQTMHAFTNPMANDPSVGTVYQPRTAQQAFDAAHQFFREYL